MGPALFFGLALFTVFDLPTLLVASVIIDIEPFYVMYLNVSGYPLHGFLHSYLGASIMAILLALIIYPIRNKLNRIMLFLRVSQEFSFKKIVFTSFVGVFSHVFLDSFLYGEMNPFFPFEGNPFFNLTPISTIYVTVYGFCAFLLLMSVPLYIYRISRSAKA